MLKRFGYVRVAAMVPEMRVANVNFNVTNIVSELQQAVKQGAQLIVFPELCISGYTCGDLFFQQALLEECKQGLASLLWQSKDWNATYVVGMPLNADNQLFNVAVVVSRGEILGVIPKTYIPNYSEFYEKRWFASGNLAVSSEIDLLGQTVPFGTNLVFKDPEDADNCFGVEICEDVWGVNPPSNRLALHGATILLNLSASNELIGKYDYRKQLVQMQSAKCFCAYVYTSCGINESSSDVVFSGHSIIAENGTILAESERFLFESTSIVQDIDFKRLATNRIQNRSFMEVCDKSEVRVLPWTCEDTNTKLLRVYDKFPFVPAHDQTRHERCAEIFNIQSGGLAKRLKHICSYKTVIGVSGGLDSTLAFLVILQAYKKLGASSKDLIAVTMPGFGTTSRTLTNAKKLMKSYGVTMRQVDIKQACELHLKNIEHNGQHDITYENAQARERTQVLMDIANQQNAIVVGTGDLSELMLGWATYNGDHMSMYSVNASIPKTLVSFLVKWVADTSANQEQKQVLYDILNTPISPELLPSDASGNIAQKTELVIGPYTLHDFFTYHFLRYGASPQKISFLAQETFKSDYTKQEIISTLKQFIKRFFHNQFKRNCLPDGPKVGSISLSPRGDWRMPSDADGALWLNQLQELEE